MNAAEKQRAARRRATWTGQTVDGQTPRSRLYADLTLEERLRAFVALNRRVWGWGEEVMVASTDRRSWPGEIIGEPSGASSRATSGELVGTTSGDVAAEKS